jgi:hypothetical protein
LPYCSPEVFQINDSVTTVNGSHTAWDIYSFGISIFELVSRTKAWNDLSSLKSLPDLVCEPQSKRPILTSSILKREDEDPHLQSLLQIMEQCWKPKADERPSFEDILKMILQ